MGIFEDLTRLRDARLKAERSLLKAAVSKASKHELGTLPDDQLLQLEKIHDEIEELNEIRLGWLYKNKP
jgi:hypothetical protein